ncbi:MAG: radical SAM protein [Candidatus Omnitrophica bacterium]|nr:radical SAM protein [Candidatus Omnitrophota bacterium]MBU1808432.1 radical SAM protein [Candidatus Omnitrophota bacterium]
MPIPLISDDKGNISFDHRLKATGMEGGRVFRLDRSGLIKLPAGSRLFMLPSRQAVGYDQISGKIMPIESSLAVAASLAPGYTATYSAAYRPIGRPKQLPLFSYAAVSAYKGELYTPAILVDNDKRHDCRYIDITVVRKKILKFSKLMPKNRLIGHLKTCALIHGCPNAQNFFLSRYEAPLPVSQSCNATCLGCISFQHYKRCPASQPRIRFAPTAEEVMGIALFHIENVRQPIVSFGQGCEGEPLLQDDLIAKTIALIRKETSKGTIHMNTNGSRPDALARLLDAGLDSVRISLNSARESYYRRYYRPRGYAFGDVMDSISASKKKGAFVSINYLTMPGFTDTVNEFKAFKRLVLECKVDMIQWRNLNYDPLAYFKELDSWPKSAELLGIKTVIDSLSKELPSIRMGYFNPAL